MNTKVLRGSLRVVYVSETPPPRFQSPFQSRSVNTVTEDRTVQGNSKQLDEFVDDLKAKVSAKFSLVETLWEDILTMRGKVFS